ncbi:MAG: NAD-dependent epimerase/dehydratase family protein [Aquisalimonadaceae bacterium]
MNEKSSSGLVAVTGATGFLGAVLCRKLVEDGRSVRAIFRNPRKVDSLKDLDVERIEADVTDARSMLAALQGVEIVYHVAALFREQGVPDSAFWETNVEGVRNVLAAASSVGVRRVVHCSTVGVHSHIPSPPADESEAYRPGDIYQETKCEGEKLALQRFREGEIDGCVVRPAMIWGPGDNRTLKLFRGIARRRMPVIGTGKIQLHWALVDDVARGMILAGDSERSTGQVYIIAGREPVTIEELFDLIAKHVGSKPLRFRVPARPVQVLGDIVERICRPLGIEPPIYRRRVDFFTKTRAFDWSKARVELGYTPGQSLDDEVKLIVASYKKLGWL